MKVSDFVIQETVNNSGESKYTIGKMVPEYPISFLQLIGLREIKNVFEPVMYDLQIIRRRYYSYGAPIVFDNADLAKSYIEKMIIEIHDKKINSTKIISIP